MFTYDIQLAGYPFKKFDEKGWIDFDHFVKEFDAFPWVEQLKLRENMQDGCSATLSVKNKLTHNDFWVSIADNKGEPLFLVGYVYPKRKRVFWGLGAQKEVKWVEIYEVEKPEEVKRLFHLYFNQEMERLQQDLRRFKKFDEMQAYLS